MLALRRHEAAKRIGISLRALDKLIASGALPVVRVGRRVVVLPADVDAFLNARRSTTKPDAKAHGGRA